MLRKCGGVSIQRALAVMERMSEGSHRLFIDQQRAAKLCHYLYQLQNANAMAVFLIKGSYRTGLLRSMDVVNYVFYVFFIENENGSVSCKK